MTGLTDHLGERDIQVMQLLAESAAAKAVEKQTGTLRHEMRSISESTAELMATRISAQINERMRDMEGRLREEIVARVDRSTAESLGMDRDDHIQQHRKLAELIEQVEQVNRTIWSNIIKTLVAVAFAAWITTGSEVPVFKSPVDRNLYPQFQNGLLHQPSEGSGE